MTKEGHDDNDDNSIDHQTENDISSTSSQSIITKVLNELAVVKHREHNILTFQEMEIMKQIRTRYCWDLLIRRNIAILLIPYVESVDEVIGDFRTIGRLVPDRYIADGSLVIEGDAHLLISHADGSGFHNYIEDHQTQARQKGKEGLGIILDINGLLLMGDVEKLLKFESEICPRNHPELQYTSLLCCYNGFLFDKIERKHRETIFNNHHRKLCGLTTSD